MPKREKKLGVGRDDLLTYLTRTDITSQQRRLAELRLEYSEIGRVYTSEIPALSVERIYPTILPIQVTGRWSYIKPSLNNFSKKCINPECPPGFHSKTAQCWGMVDCVRPDQGTFWIEHDLDAVEHRIYALILGWSERLQQLQAGEDIHTPVACELFSLELPSNLLDPHKAVEDAAWRLRVKWQGKDDPRRTLSKNFTYGGQYFYVRALRRGEVVRKPYRMYQGLWYNPSFVYTIPNIQTFKVENELRELVPPDFEELAVRFFESTVEIQRRKAAWQEQCRKDKYARNLYGGVRRAYKQTQDTAKELFNSIIQGTVAEYIDETAITFQETWPDSYCVHNKCDSLKWAFPETYDEQETLAECKRLAQRTLTYAGSSVDITATFKIVRREEHYGD